MARKTHLRVSTGGRFCAACSAIIFVCAVVAIGRGRSLLDVGILQTHYTVVMPSGIIGLVTTVELWVDSLPSQVFEQSL